MIADKLPFFTCSAVTFHIIPATTFFQTIQVGPTWSSSTRTTKATAIAVGLNPRKKFVTPNLKRIAREGIIFIDRHSVGVVCTPSRYAWSTNIEAVHLVRIADCIIEDARTTLDSLLSDCGYSAAVPFEHQIFLGLAQVRGAISSQRMAASKCPSILSASFQK